MFSDVISVEESIARTFQLRSYSEVIVNRVDFKSVALDSVQVTFKDQYLGRSEMWRLKTRLVLVSLIFTSAYNTTVTKRENVATFYTISVRTSRFRLIHAST